VCLAALAVTPVLIGAFFDAHASYRGALLAMAAASALVALVWTLAVRADPRAGS
jgi:cyanate permease